MARPCVAKRTAVSCPRLRTLPVRVRRATVCLFACGTLIFQHLIFNTFAGVRVDETSDFLRLVYLNKSMGFTKIQLTRQQSIVTGQHKSKFDGVSIFHGERDEFVGTDVGTDGMGYVVFARNCDAGQVLNCADRCRLRHDRHRHQIQMVLCCFLQSVQFTFRHTFILKILLTTAFRNPAI